MTRGRKPVAAIAEAKKFAERMGYRWQENTHPDLAYDLFIFKPQMACIVRVRQTRYQIDPDAIYENLIPEDLSDVRALPFPKVIPREIWLRTQHERTWRRLRIHELSVGELEWWGPDDYTNPYSR
ncbi:hypothetical protein Mboo_0775 [Methanoregula boonei 6A8]|jgi:hypothetical protein|uniref:Endonuclease n=1 Tax=Methanoregula boonei (strain DSM 21154 / JCM 14090 / 6A8) TaxID=456442 RepID=A7I6D2_METB6|nr:hypothetical protein [Methanoregula boonei]ABS55293.1 hypothetical protein Mboo_0775 [Methanoregula boonei 6A8]